MIVLLTLVGLGLRVFRLENRPLGFTWDEAALGYNAYSLLRTGRDEYGQPLPLVLKSFGDFKPGLYSYLAVPTIRFFGLNEFAVRLPSAFFGALLIPIMYLLIIRLLRQRVAVFSAALMAINPWSIHFSRAAWEANIALFFTSIAVLLFVRRRFLSSAFFFGLTFLTYQGAKFFTPSLLLILLFQYRKSFKPKQLVLPGFVLAFLLLPIVTGLSTQSGRLKVFSVFSYTRSPATISEILKQDDASNFNLIYFLFHPETLDQLRGISQRYLNHFSPKFLFFTGDWSNPRQATPFVGYLHLPELLTLTIGLYLCLKHPRPGVRVLLAWLLLAPLPSALSRDIISAVRSLPLVVPLTAISALGFSSLTRKKIVLVGTTLIFLFFFSYFLDLYFVHSPHYTATGWLFPYKPALGLVHQYQDQYSRVVISDALGQPYIFALFYLRYDPYQYQSQAFLNPSPVGDVGHVSQFGKYIFRPIYWPVDRALTSTLFVGNQYELPEADLRSTSDLITLGEITPPDGSPNWRVVALP